MGSSSGRQFVHVVFMKNISYKNCVYKLARGVKADRRITNVLKTRAGRIKSYLSSIRERMKSAVLRKKNKRGDVCGSNKPR
jgi:hypothetical protein